MTSLAELLAWPDRKLVVLAELTPSLTLGGFVAAGGGLTNTFKVNLARTAHSSYWTGGIYRRVVGVRENATDLTERASAALVDANASSWFWDEAAGVLYVRSSTSSDPDTFTAYQAFVTLYTATHPVVLNRTDGSADTGIYYLPWLSGEALPEITHEMADPLFGATITEGGEISFTNGHGAWHDLIPTYNWKNKRVRLFIGGSYNGQDLLRSQYSAHTTMIVEDVAADEHSATLMLKPLLRQLDVNVPPTPYFASDYANLGDGVEGTHKWIGYGRSVMVPDLTDTTVSQGRYTVADAAKQTLFAVHNVWAVAKSNGARTLLTVTTHYTVDLTACTITVVSASYPHADYTLEADVTGKPDGAGSYLKTFGQIVKDMLTTFAGVSVTADLVTADFTQADIDNPDEMAVWLKEPRSLASVFATAEPGFASLERSALGSVLMTLDGKWTVKIFDPNADPSTLTSLRKEDFAEFSPEPKLETVFSTARVRYAYNHAKQAWLSAQDTDSKTQYISETVEVLEAYTFLRNASAALVLAQRYQFISGSIPLEIEFSERGARLALHKAGDKVAVTYSPAPVDGGALSSRVFELLRITRSFEPDLKITGRLGDLRGIGEAVGRWTSSTAPAWAAASQAERDSQGFWSDSAGLVDPADGSTRDISVWW